MLQIWSLNPQAPPYCCTAKQQTANSSFTHNFNECTYLVGATLRILKTTVIKYNHYSPIVSEEQKTFLFCGTKSQEAP